MANNANASLGMGDQQKSFNHSDNGAYNSNFNSQQNDGPRNAFNNLNSQTRIDYQLSDIDAATAPYRDAGNMGSCCVRIANMNNRTHYAAIRKFFYGLQIPNDGIKLLNDESGRRRNDVVVRFARPDIARDALALDGKMLNGNSVRITSIDDADYENEIDSFQPPRRNASRFGRDGSEDSNRDSNSRRSNRERGYPRSRFNDDSDGHGGNNSNDGRNRRADDDDDVMLITDSNDDDTVPVGLTLLIEDLPPFAKEQDIIKMFPDFTLMDIQLAKVNKQFRAYVKFHNQSDAESALKQTHLHRIEFKSVFVSPCSEETFERAKGEYDGIVAATSKPEVSNFYLKPCLTAETN